MSTSPIQSSGSYSFAPVELPYEVSGDSSNPETGGESAGHGAGSEGVRDGPGGLRGDIGDRSVPLGTMPDNRPLPGNATQAGMVYRGPSDGSNAGNNASPGQTSSPNAGPTIPRDAPPAGAGERPAPPDRTQGPGPDPRAQAATGDGKPNAGDTRGPGSQPGNNGPGQSNGNGYGSGHAQNPGNGNGYANSGGVLSQIGNGVSNLLGGLLGNNSILQATLPSLISSQSLSNSTLGGAVTVATSALPLLPGSVNAGTNIPANTLHTPLANANTPSALPAHSQTGLPSAAQNQTIALPLNAPRAATTPQHSMSANTSQGAQPSPFATNTPLATRSAISGSATDAAHSPVATSTIRGAAGDLPATNNALTRGQVQHEPVNSVGTQAANTQANSARQNAQVAIPAVSAQTSLLTLVMSPHVQAGNDETGVTHMALFRGQNAEGQESIRDILGRSYVFNADGKLITRAEERRTVDVIGTREANEISEHSASNHGELSTHELVWKVVTPALIGVGALLGGTTAGAAAAAGSSGVASAFLLTTATAIFGYGAVRAGLGLRSMADSGQVINPVNNPATIKQWVAAGTQSVGGVASLIALLV